MSEDSSDTSGRPGPRFPAGATLPSGGNDASYAADVARVSDEPNAVSGVSGTGNSTSVEIDVAPAEETASLMKQLTVGSIVDGKYRIDEVIGKGAMGVVLAATHIHLRERVALKFLSTRAHAQADDFHSRFRREAQVSAKLRNEHITRVIDVGMWREKVPFMVMDLLVGDDLRRALKAAPEGRLPVNVALDYVVQICEGLAEAHSHGIVHRDLKPSNLFIVKRHDGSDLLKILDFGISKWSTQEEQLEELTQTGVVLGSPKYMAPEQLFGSADVDGRADVWSIGAIFYEMLTGRPPFDFPTLTRICAELATDRPPPSLIALLPEMPPQIEGVLFQCFARDRDKRMPNVAELAGALLEAVDAPFAGQVRQKIGSMLDPKGMSSGMGTTSGSVALGTGNYRSLSMSGSNSPLSSSSGAYRMNSPSSAATAGGVEAPGAEAEGKKKRGILIGSVIGAIALLMVLLFVFSNGHSDTTKGTAAVPTGPVGTTVAATLPPAAAVTASAPVAVAPAPTPRPADSAAAAPAPQAPARGGGQHYGGGGGAHHGGGKASPPPAPPPTVAAAPAPTPAPAPPPPAPTTKANPLEDRQ